MDLVTDKKTIRTIQLIYLLADTSDMVTMEDLAEELNVTKKTIKNDLVSLAEFVPTMNEFIQIKKETIIFNRNSESTIEEVLAKMLNKQPLFFLLRALLEGEEYSLKEWSEQIWVSERTLRRFLPQLKKVLKSYNLSLQIAPYFSLIGNENDIRFLFFDYISQSGWHEQDLLIDKTVQQFYDISYRNYSITLSVDNNRVKIWIYVLVQRLKRMCHTKITFETNESLLKEEQFASFSKLFIKLMDQYFDIKKIPLIECIYAYILLLDTVIYLSPTAGHAKKIPIEKLTYKEQDEQVFTFDDRFTFEGEKLAEIQGYIASLLENISLLSLLTPLYQSNPYELNTYAQETFPDLYEECLKNIMNIKLSHQAQLVYPKDIATKVTLLLSPYLLNDFVENNRKLLVNITGESCYTVHLFSLLKKTVPSNYEIVCVFGEIITDMYIEKNKIDIVIHNDVMIKPIKACPVIKVSHFPSKREVEQLMIKLFEL